MIHLEPQEEIRCIVHKHWLVYVLEGTLIVGLIVVPIMLLPMLFRLSIFSIAGDTFFLFLFFASIWILVSWVLFFIIWTVNYLDALVVTNKRIIDVEQIGLFSREVSSLRLDRIQDVTIEIHGIFATFFSYGNILIQTAGEAREIRLNMVRDPEETKQRILALHHEMIDKYHHLDDHAN